ncbi:MAG: ATP-binding protein [Chloroflexi bacterium]|nr:ATP-binding protein [Chloroflexota bacterium]
MKSTSDMASTIEGNGAIDSGADLAAQHDYVEKLKAAGFEMSLVVADAFVRGMRDVGYRSTATALNEEIDNAIQAGARNIDILWPSDEAKPTAIAVVDDGHGMEPDMLRPAVMWGGTHREGSRSGFGRYGYGLPSSSVSMGRRFTVFSRTDGGEWFAVTIDVDEISAGKYTVDGKILVPEPRPAVLPQWLKSRLETRYRSDGPEHGTVVLVEKLDRLTFRTAGKLRPFLLEKTGVTYRRFLREITIRIDDQEAEPTDPLFLTPGFRYYESYPIGRKMVTDPDRAEALPAAAFEVKDQDTGKSLGVVKVRYAAMPPTFARVPEDKHKVKGGKLNPRFHVLDDNNGLIILRKGRQIDVLTATKKSYLGYFNNDDRYWGVEIDFPPTLDEEFSITTTKQQVVMSERMWDLLRDAGVFLAIKELRKRYDDAKTELKAKAEKGGEDGSQPRPSEEVMADIAKFKTRTPTNPADLEQRGEENFQRDLQRRAAEAGVEPAILESTLRSQMLNKKYRVDSEALQGAPFFRVDQVGAQKVLWLNTAHPFFSTVYTNDELTPRLRAAIEVLLFVIGEGELEATNERRQFYETERSYWSERYRAGLENLEEHMGLTDVPLLEQGQVEGAEEERTAEAV